MQVNFNMGAERRLAVELQNGISKVRSGTMIPESGMEHAQGSSIQQSQFITAQSLMVPDVLHEPFRWQVVFAKSGERMLAVAPLPVKLGGEGRHGERALTRGVLQSQAPRTGALPERKEPDFAPAQW
jgi:hypothetical protein